jgi:hypothetical protein
MERRKAITAAAAASLTLLAGAAGIALNSGIVGADSNDDVGNLSPVGPSAKPPVTLVIDEPAPAASSGSGGFVSAPSGGVPAQVVRGPNGAPIVAVPAASPAPAPVAPVASSDDAGDDAFGDDGVEDEFDDELEAESEDEFEDESEDEDEVEEEHEEEDEYEGAEDDD